ncbi:MAG TPA: hypothetical protein VII58_11625 [Acidobacteriaceae bacterium]
MQDSAASGSHGGEFKGTSQAQAQSAAGADTNSSRIVTASTAAVQSSAKPVAKLDISETHPPNLPSTAASSSDASQHPPAPESSGRALEMPLQAAPLAGAHPLSSVAESPVTQTIQGAQLTQLLHTADVTRTFAAGANGTHAQISSGNSAFTGGLSLNPAIASGPSRLEVGIFDGTHGWLKVRAEMTAAGEIATSLTVKAPAIQALHAALPEIAGYLQSEGINIASLDLHAASARTFASAGQESLVNSGNGSGSQREQDTPESPRGGTEASSGDQRPDDSRPGSGGAAATGWRMSSLAPIWTQAATSTGGWLSICA